MGVTALFFFNFFAKCLRVGEDGPGWAHLCHIDTFLVCFFFSEKIRLGITFELSV